MKVLVTGAAGFIGMHTCLALLKVGHSIIGVDNLNSYYDPKLKTYRLEQLQPYSNFEFRKLDICDRESMAELFENESFEVVVHLAAQAGVRYSLEQPFDYTDSNITGTMAVLEGCRHHKVKHLIYASSSSVYGMNKKVPFSEDDRVDEPVSLYAATKKANELMARTYSHLYSLPTTGLRFFTVYGPAGRPDMAPWLFTEAILNGKPIKVFNHGEMERDFTYVDDIVDGILSLLTLSPNAAESYCRVLNIGNNKPVKLGDFISEIELLTGIEAEKIFMPMQSGDVKRTFADINKISKLVDYKPRTNISSGMASFVEWFKKYHNLK